MNNINEEIIEIAKELPEWFTSKAIENMKKDIANLKVITKSENNLIAGFIIYEIKNKKCFIRLMAVKKDFQGKGIGGKLIKKLIKICKKDRIKVIEVDTLAETENYAPYEKTRNFYFSVGFVKDKIIKGGYEDGDDKLILKMSLSKRKGGEDE